MNIKPKAVGRKRSQEEGHMGGDRDFARSRKNNEVFEAICAFIGAPPEVLAEIPAKFSAPRKKCVLSRSPSRSLRRQLAGSGYSHMSEFCVLSRGGGEVAWLLPVTDSQTMRSGLQMYQPFALRGRFLKTMLAGAIRFGWKGRFASTVLLASVQLLPLQILITEITGEEHPVFALWLGNREHFRTMTVEVMRPGGEVLGFVKLPLTNAATVRVRQEAKFLEWLWDRSPSVRPHIPRVLHSGEWDGGFMLFQSSGPRATGPTAFCSMHRQFLRQLWNTEPVSRAGSSLITEAAADWQKSLPQLPSEWCDLGQASLQQASRCLERRTVLCGVMHGDFAPWNTRQENGRLFVFDWESAENGRPTLWDVFHFNEKITSLLHGAPVQDEEISLRGATVDALFLLYSLRRVSKALEDGGSLLQPKLDWHKQQIRTCLKRCAESPAQAGNPNSQNTEEVASPPLHRTAHSG